MIATPCSKVCKNISMFLTPPNCSMEAKIVEKQLNCGGGYGLEIPVPYHFLGTAKPIDCSKTKLEILEKSLIVMSEIRECTLSL